MIKPKVSSVALVFMTAQFALAAVPTEWTVETSRIENRRLDAFHGEELAIKVAFMSYGTPLEITGKTARLYWQTNGMDRLYWSTNAIVTAGSDGATNALSAVFTPAMDPGASAIRAFLGIAGENYRANFVIRFRDSPGAVPNVIEMPVPRLDFSQVETVNAPWIEANSVYTKSETEQYVQSQIIAAGSITEDGVKNIVTNDTSTIEVGSSFVCGQVYTNGYGESFYYVTNTAVRWSGECFEMHLVGQNVYQSTIDSIDGWYKCSTTNEYPNPYTTVNSNLNSLATTVYIGDKDATGFSQNLADALVCYANGTQAYTNDTHNALGLAYAADIGKVVTNAVPSWALAETPPESMTGNALVLTNATVQTKDGTAVAASDIGAISAVNPNNSASYAEWNGLDRLRLHGDFRVDNILSDGYISTSGSISGSEFLINDGTPVVYGITTNGTDYLHADVNLRPIADDARSALAYASGVYQYMNANTNAWFEGTNYNVTASVASNKVVYAAEAWEDVAFTPCSLQLYEIRDGNRNKVWDQRDWTVYYWNFKSAQLSNNLARATSTLSQSVSSNYMSRGWSKYTAVNGLDNPNPSTLFVDTEKVSLMAGMQWEKMIELSGHAYYTITGNGITISSNDQNSTFLTIKDFEGNACLTFRKTSSYLVYCECGTEITNNFIDASGNVCFTINTDTQPTAEFSTTLNDEDFVEQGETGCPVDYEWTGSAGNWVCHFLLKSGIESDSCFARFKMLREGENVVEHTVPIKLDGGIVFTQGGSQYKIKPSVSGSTVTWNIVQ